MYGRQGSRVSYTGTGDRDNTGIWASWVGVCIGCSEMVALDNLGDSICILKL